MKNVKMKNVKKCGRLIVGGMLLLGLAGCTSSSERKTKEAYNDHTGPTVAAPPMPPGVKPINPPVAPPANP